MVIHDIFTVIGGGNTFIDLNIYLVIKLDYFDIIIILMFYLVIKLDCFYTYISIILIFI